MSASINQEFPYTASPLEKSDSSLKKREQWNLIADRCVKIGLGFFTLGNCFGYMSNDSYTITLGAFAGELTCAFFAGYAWIQAARS